MKRIRSPPASSTSATPPSSFSSSSPPSSYSSSLSSSSSSSSPNSTAYRSSICCSRALPSSDSLTTAHLGRRTSTTSTNEPSQQPNLPRKRLQLTRSRRPRSPVTTPKLRVHRPRRRPRVGRWWRGQIDHFRASRKRFCKTDEFASARINNRSCNKRTR